MTNFCAHSQSARKRHVRSSYELMAAAAAAAAAGGQPDGSLIAVIGDEVRLPKSHSCSYFTKAR